MLCAMSYMCQSTQNGVSPTVQKLDQVAVEILRAITESLLSFQYSIGKHGDSSSPFSFILKLWARIMVVSTHDAINAPGAGYDGSRARFNLFCLRFGFPCLPSLSNF